MDLAVGGNVALVEGEELAYRSRQGLGESAEALSPVGMRWWLAGMLGEGCPPVGGSPHVASMKLRLFVILGVVPRCSASDRGRRGLI